MLPWEWRIYTALEEDDLASNATLINTANGGSLNAVLKESSSTKRSKRELLYEAQKGPLYAF